MQQAQTFPAPVPALHLPAVPSSGHHAAQQGGTQLNSSLLATANTSIAASTSHAVPAFATTTTPSRLLAAHTNSMGVFSTYKSQSAIADSLKLSSAQRHIDGVASHLVVLQGESDVLRAQFDQERRLAESLEADVDAMRHELNHDLPSLSNALERRTKSTALAQSLAGAEERLRLQRDVVLRTQKRFESRDLEKDRYQYELAQLESLQSLLAQKKEEESFQLALVSQASEQHNARLRARQQRKQLRDDAATREEDAAQAARDLADHLRAEEHRQRQAVELRELARQVEEREAALSRLRTEAVSRRKSNILELKSSTAAAQNDLLASNAKRAKQLEKREARRAHERAELAGAGRNPDAIFAARDEEARLAHKARRIAGEQKVRAARLQSQMEMEASKQLAADQAQARAALVLHEYKREMGHSVIDTRAGQMEHARKRREEMKRNEEALLVRQLENARFVPEDVSEPDDDDSDEDGINALRPQTVGSVTAAAAAPSVDHDSSDDDFSTGGPPPSDAPLLSPSELKAALKNENRIPGATYNEWGLRVIPNHSDPYRARLDAKKITRALDAQRTSLAEGAPKVVCGKTYPNTSHFLSDPPEIVFNDFTVGEEMRQTITLTNVSFSFNHFKLLAIADAYVDFFEILYTPVGRMSAGSIAKITIIFRPKVNEDIRTVLPLLAETGPFAIPLICRTKKACIRVQPELKLDMGVTVLGDSSTAHVTIENHGAVPVDFIVVPIVKQRRTQRETTDAQFQLQSSERKRLTSDDGTEEKEQLRDPLTVDIVPSLAPLNLGGILGDAITSNDALQHALDDETAPAAAHGPNDASLLDPSQISLAPDFHRSSQDELLVSRANADLLEYSMEYLSFATTGRVEAYSSTRWSLNFRPVIDGAWSHSFQLKFGPQTYARDQRPIQWGSEKDFEVEVVGAGTKVPIYVEKDLVDLQTVCYGKLYRTELVLRNRHQTAHKIQMHLPTRLRALADFIDFTPRVGYIQGLDTLRVQVKVTPSREMWRLLRETTLASSRGCINEAQYAIGHVHVPMSIEVTDQILPVLWSLTGRLVDPSLELSVRSLDFGSVFTSESKALSVVLTNRSPLLQKVSFVRLRPEMRVEPHDGMLTIPPFRSAEVNLIFSPTASIEYAFTVEARTKLGETIRLPVVGVGKKPRVQLQHTRLAFEATPNFNQTYETNYLANLSKHHRHTIEFIVDEPEETEEVANSIHSQRSFLRVFPRTVQLEPLPAEDPGAATSTIMSPKSTMKTTPATLTASQARVEVEFRPFLNLDELSADIGAPLEDEEDADALGEEAPTEEPPAELTSPSAKKGATTAKRSASSKKKLSAEAEAEAAKKLAAEEELRRLAAEKASLAAQLAEEAAARAATAEFEFHSREGREERERVRTKNERPERNWVEFSDRLQLQIDAAESARDEAQARLDEIALAQQYDDDEEDEEDEFDNDPAFTQREDEDLVPSKLTVHEPFSRHARHRIAAHIRSEHVSTGVVTFDVMFLDVTTTLVLPMLQVRQKHVDFGQVPLGKTSTKSFEVRNTSDTDTVQLAMDTLGYSANFHVLSALRVLRPGEIQIIVVEFKPRREGKHFKQDLILRSRDSPNIQVTVPLVGLCISPNLELVLSPPSSSTTGTVVEEVTRNWPATNEDLQMQLLHLGDCVAHDQVSRTFTVRNLGAYPYAFHLSQHDVLDGGGAAAQVHGSSSSLTSTTHNAAAGSPTEFYFVPSQGLIPPNGGTTEITVHFTPTTPTTFFPYQTIVEVGNQRLKIQAEVHERQIFMQGGRQVLVNDTHAHLAEPPLQAQVEGDAFQNKSLVAGFTRVSPDLIYQNPLAFLDGPAIIGQSVGGGAIASAYPNLMTDDAWDRVLADDAGVASVSRIGAASESEKGKGGKAAGKKDAKKPPSDAGKKDGGAGGADQKDSARGRSSSYGTIADSTPLDPNDVAPRIVEITFDTTRPIGLNNLLAAGSSSSGSKARVSSSSGSGSSKVLVEVVQIGHASVSPALSGVDPASSKAAEKDTPGSFDIAITHANNEKEKAPQLANIAANASSSQVTPSPPVPTASSTAADALGPESVMHLFSVEPSSGTLKAGSKEKVHFMFDWTKYQQIKADDAERRVLSVGRWLEAAARVTLKGGFAPPHLPHQQTIEVRLRVYVE